MSPTWDKKIDLFENKAQASGNSFKSRCKEEVWEYDEDKTKRKHFLAIVLAKFQVILRDKWEEAMRDGANSDAVLVDHVSSAHEMLNGCKGTVYNIGGWMLKILLQVKDKTKVAAVKWFVDANTVSVKEARENTKWEHSLDQGQPSLNLHFTSKQSIMLISPKTFLRRGTWQTCHTRLIPS